VLIGALLVAHRPTVRALSRRYFVGGAPGAGCLWAAALMANKYIC